MKNFISEINSSQKYKLPIKICRINIFPNKQKLEKSLKNPTIF